MLLSLEKLPRWCHTGLQRRWATVISFPWEIFCSICALQSQGLCALCWYISFLQDMGQGPFDVVAVTDKPERAHALISSLKWPLRLRLLQPPPSGRPWRYRWFDTERYLLQLAESIAFENVLFLARDWDLHMRSCWLTDSSASSQQVVS